MRLRRLARKRCSVKIKLTTRVHVYYTKTPMCELTRDSRRKPQSGAHWRRGTAVTLFLLSLWDTHQHLHNRDRRNMWHGDSLQLWEQGKDRGCPGSRHTIKKNLTASLASWPVPVVPAFGRPPGIVARARSPSIWEAEVGEDLRPAWATEWDCRCKKKKIHTNCNPAFLRRKSFLKQDPKKNFKWRLKLTVWSHWKITLETKIN